MEMSIQIKNKIVLAVEQNKGQKKQFVYKFNKDKITRLV